MVDPGFIFEPNLGPKYRVFNLHMYSILSKLSSDGASKGVNICLSVRIITVLDTFVNIISSKDRRRLASAQKYVGTCPSVLKQIVERKPESKLVLAQPRPEHWVVGAPSYTNSSCPSQQRVFIVYWPLWCWEIYLRSLLTWPNHLANY